MQGVSGIPKLGQPKISPDIDKRPLGPLLQAFKLRRTCARTRTHTGSPRGQAGPVLLHPPEAGVWRGCDRVWLTLARRHTRRGRRCGAGPPPGQGGWGTFHERGPAEHTGQQQLGLCPQLSAAGDSPALVALVVRGACPSP